MRSRRLSECLCLAASWLLLGATAAPAQVDWSDLFPEEGHKAAPKAAREPQQLQPAPAPVRPAVRQAERAPAPVRSHQVARPQRPAAKRHVARTKHVRQQVARRVTDEGARPAPQYDREFLEPLSAARPGPAARAQEAAEPETDGAQRNPEAAPAPVVAKPVAPAVRPAPVAPKRMAPPAEPPPVVAKAVEPAPEAAPEVAGENIIEQPAAQIEQPAAQIEQPVAHIEQPAAHKRAQTGGVAAEAKPVPEAEAAPVVSRAHRALAAQAAASGERAGSVPAAEESAASGSSQVAAEVQLAKADRGSVSMDGNDGLATNVIEPGEVVTDKNVDKYKHLLSPGMEWAVRYGWRMKVVAPRRVSLPKAYNEATEKYSSQVKLTPDGLRVLNWTAGQPFPNIDPNDPQVALKIMWNYSYNFRITDDYDSKNFEADTGNIGKNQAMTVERHYLVDNLRQLMYTGRLFVDPKPNLPNPDDIRFKESLHPLSEPFDLKGVGTLFNRYNSPDRQDDTWMYLPSLRRVRRMSAAQRSDALFGQDSDLDSYYGYNGQIPWMDWRYLGERTILAVMHGQNVPVKWQEPEDWAFDDVWEPRQVYVVEGMSKVPQYAYGKRIIFIDKQGWVIPYTDIYDRAGQLWKVWLNLYSVKKEAYPGAKLSRYSDEMAFVHALIVFDTQLVHATRVALPSTHSPDKECTFFNMGAKSGTTEDFFTVANLIEAGH